MSLTFKHAVRSREVHVLEDAEGLLLAGRSLHHVYCADPVPGHLYNLAR